MTSSSPDIESLIAAADRHVRYSVEGYQGAAAWCRYDNARWPCPDRLLIDALVPVYEAAKAVSEVRKPMRNGLVPSTLDRKIAALRAALGEPNA